jgi:hypothetical protein
MPPPVPAPPFRLREYSRALLARRDLRMMLALWRRQSGKTTVLALRALREMAAHPGRLVTFASASLLVGREVVEKEARLFREILRSAPGPVSAHSGDSGKDLLAGGTGDDFAEVFEARRMVVKLWSDKTTCSRTQIIAPNPATARGFTGSVMIDECGLIPDFRGVWDAMIYIMASDPGFTCLLATTPPIDDSHFSHELLLAPPGAEFQPAAAGHWYRSSAGLDIHRVDVYDGLAAGARLYHPRTGESIDAATDRQLSLDRESWDRNMALKMAAQGTAACSRLALSRAQAHPLSTSCLAVDDAETPPAGWPARTGIAPGALVGLGFDVATTDGDTSNFSSLSVAVLEGGSIRFPLVWRWKTRDANEAIRRVCATLDALTGALGASPRALCVDASSERYFANLLREASRSRARTLLISSADTFTDRGVKWSYKQYLGDTYCSDLEDGRIILPASRWLLEDHRLVRKEGGRYSSLVATDGCHADSFDSNKLARHALVASRPAYARAVRLRTGGRERGGI